MFVVAEEEEKKKKEEREESEPSHRLLDAACMRWGMLR